MVKDILSHQNKSEFKMVQDTLSWLSLSIRSYVVRCGLQANSNNSMIHIPANWICCHTGCCDDITIWKYMLLNISQQQWPVMMISWHGKAFLISGILWENPPATGGWIPLKRAIDVKVWWLLLAPASHYWTDSEIDSVLSTWYSLQCPYKHYIVAFILPPALKKKNAIHCRNMNGNLYLYHLPISLFIFKFVSNTSI